jgi:hypothetical protein
MFVLSDLDAMVLARCRSYGRAKSLSEADFQDFVQTVRCVVLDPAKGRDLSDATTLDRHIVRAIWATYKQMSRTRERQADLERELISQARAAQFVETGLSIKSHELISDVVAVAEANLSATQIASIVDRDYLRKNGMEQGTIRQMARRSIKKLKEAAVTAGLLGLMLGTGVLLGLAVSARNGGEVKSPTKTEIQSVNAPAVGEHAVAEPCRAGEERAAAAAAARAGAQSCVASAVAGAQSCRASAVAKDQSCRAARLARDQSC